MNRSALATILALAIFSVGAARATTVYAEINENFGTLDLTTGQFTLINASEPEFEGLGYVGGTIYGVNLNADLYSIDPTTGTATKIGPTGLGFDGVDDFGSTLTGLYLLSNSNPSSLYSVDPSTGAATQIAALSGVTTGATQGLSTNSSTLYYELQAQLYTINLTTGAATAVGSGASHQYSASILEGSTLYAGNANTFTIDSIDPSTGAVTPGPSLTGDPGATTFVGFVPDNNSGVPEPSAMWLTLGGIAAILGLAKKGVI